MSSTPLLRVIDGGGPEAGRAPALPPARESERLFPDFHKGRYDAFIYVVAVSLVLHGVIILGSTIWNDAGEERAAGGSDEEIVIEGIDVVLFDQMPNVASPLVEAPEIRDAEVAESLAADDVALLAPEKPTDVPADRVMPVSDNSPVQPSGPDRADIDTAAVAILPADETVPMKPQALTPVPAAKAQVNGEILDAEIEPASPVKPTTAAAVPDSKPLTVTSATPATPADAALTAVIVPAAKSQPTSARNTKPLESVPVESAPVEAEPAPPAIQAVDSLTVARPADTAPRIIEDHAAVPVAPDTAPAETVARDDHLKPDDETTAIAAAAAHPDPPLPPRKPVEVPKPEALEVIQKTAASPAPSRAASAAEPVARGPGRATAGAGGKSKTAKGTATLASYQAKLVAHLRRYRSYPDAARRRQLQGTASVSFTINGSGRVVSASLARSTGHAILDREAIAMVRRASPFPAIPSALGKSRVTVHAPVRFDIR